MSQNYLKLSYKIFLTIMFIFSLSLKIWAHPNPPGCEEAAAAIKKAEMEYNEARKTFFEVEDKVKRKRNEITRLNKMFDKAQKDSGLALLELDQVMIDKATCDEWNNNPEGIPPLFDCGEIPNRLKEVQKKIDDAEWMIQETDRLLTIAEEELKQLEDKMSIAFQRKEAAFRAIKEAKDAWAALGCHLHA